MARILLSALSARRGGGLTYLRHVVAGFPQDAEHKLSIFSAAPLDGLPELPNIEWLPAPSWTVNPVWRFLFGFIYFRFLWAQRADFDAVYFPGGSFDLALPRRVRRIVAFRNMVPFDAEASRRFGHGLLRMRVLILRHVQAWAFRRADLVIFISQYAREVIDAAVTNRRGASVVIPHGTAPTTSPLSGVIAARLPESFVLYLSILDVYKAQIELVEAWAKLIAAAPRPEKLVLAGPESPSYGAEVRNAITRLKLENDVILLGNIPHNQISDLTRRATLNVFLSSCENCPNILLELMAIGSPLLVSTRQPMPELGGPDLDYVDPYDIDGIARALTRLLDDPSRRESIAKAAIERSARYSWPRTADATWRAILDCVDTN